MPKDLQGVMFTTNLDNIGTTHHRILYSKVSYPSMCEVVHL